MRAELREGQELGGNWAVIKTDRRIPPPAEAALLLGLSCCLKFSKPTTTLSHYRGNKTNLSSCSVSHLEHEFLVSVKLVSLFFLAEPWRFFQRVMEERGSDGELASLWSEVLGTVLASWNGGLGDGQSGDAWFCDAGAAGTVSKRHSLEEPRPQTDHSVSCGIMNKENNLNNLNRTGHPELWREFSEITGDNQINKSKLKLWEVSAIMECQWKQRWAEDSLICKNQIFMLSMYLTVLWAEEAFCELVL